MIQTLVALFSGNIVKNVITLLGKGKGEAAPGLVALRLDPNFIANRQKNIPLRIIISGTNGKTTTTHLMGKILLQQNKKTLTNPHGSNLSRGIAAALLQNTNVDATLWETDEAAFIDIFKKTQPTHTVLLNLFRDQLDRYGEIDNTVKKWHTLLSAAAPMILIINADDPNLEYIAQLCPQHKIVRFGIAHLAGKQKNKPEVHGDATFCPKCHQPLQYKLVTFSHLGKYVCSCGFERKNLDFSISYSSEEISVGQMAIRSSLKGIYSAYNFAATIALSSQLELSLEKVRQSIADFKPSFGRQEIMSMGDKKINIMLIKNPTGASQNIEILSDIQKPLTLLIAINDNFADGRDISWLWDVNFEILSKKIKQIIVTGTRALDMAVRLKYAGFDIKQLIIEDNMEKALSALFKSDSVNLYILPTYTAMLEIRKIINSNKLIK